jgi:hypothetical protein
MPSSLPKHIRQNGVGFSISKVTQVDVRGQFGKSYSVCPGNLAVQLEMLLRILTYVRILSIARGVCQSVDKDLEQARRQEARCLSQTPLETLRDLTSLERDTV